MLMRKVIELHSVRNKEEEKVSTIVKPIEASIEISDEKYVKDILKSIYTKPSENAITKNTYALNLLKRARRG